MVDVLSDESQAKKDIPVDDPEEDATHNKVSQTMHMLQGVVEIGEIAYHEEQNRKKLLIEQSSSLIIVITLLITLLGVVLSFVSNNLLIEYKIILFIGVAVTILVLLSSLICCLLVQWRMKYKQFMNALDFFEKVKSQREKFSSNITAFLEEKMKGFGDITRTETQNNNKRANWIKASCILIFVSIYLIISTAFIIFVMTLF